jgi:hypothetical protein
MIRPLMMSCFHVSPTDYTYRFYSMPLLASDFHSLCNSELSKVPENRPSVWLSELTQVQVNACNCDSLPVMPHTQVWGSFDVLWGPNADRTLVPTNHLQLFCINVTRASMLKMGISAFWRP